MTPYKKPRPISSGVKYNKLFGYDAYICYLQTNVSDIHGYFETREEAEEFLKDHEAFKT